MNKLFFYSLRWISIGILLLMGSCRRSMSDAGIPRLVKTAVVQRYTGVRSEIYPGKIKAASEVNLAFRVAGPIIKSEVAVGEHVKKGQLLACVDPRDYRLQYESALAELVQVKQESERVMELYHRNSVPVNDYDKAVAALKRMTALCGVYRNALNDTKLYAPFDGFVQQKFFDEHEIVSQGLPVFSLIDETSFEVSVDIPSRDYIRQGDFGDFFCVADVYPGIQIPLELLEITKKANYNQLFKMRFRVKPESDLALAAGMSVSVVINFLPDSLQAMVVPISSLFQQDGKSYVWVYDESREMVARSEVEVIAFRRDGCAVVKTELSPDTRIVVAGTNSLKEGQKVRQLPAVAASNIGGLL